MISFIEFIMMYIIISSIIFVFSNIVLMYVLVNIRKKEAKLIQISDKLLYNSPRILSISDNSLPLVTILLPVHREELTLPYLLKSICELDYPIDKLDVRLLVEPDDYPTLSCLLSLRQSTKNGIKFNRENVPISMKVLNGLDIQIDYVHLKRKNSRAKPKSLNIGLKNARGSFIIIYDAEDRPEPNQLKKIIAFVQSNPNVSCIQACLGYYNSEQSIITKLFSIEYMYHFHVLLPFLYSAGKVVLLAGTSNFIRTQALKGLNGWDEKNVTEDADLGIRLARNGHVTVPISTTTWEEAPPRFYPWLRQRIRWNKGYLYTLITHFKRPAALVSEIGFKATAILFYQLSGPYVNLIAFVGWILFAILWVGTLGIPISPVQQLVTQVYENNQLLLYTSIFTLLFSVTYTMSVNAIAVRRVGGKYGKNKSRYIPLLLFYNMLVSLAALVAIIEILFKPYSWNKTYHGFSITEAITK